MPTSYDFALALHEPDRPVFTLKTDNTLDQWSSLEGAAASGNPFVIHLRHGVLAVDFDDPDRRGHFDRLVYEIEGCTEPVIINSGQPGHLHLFASFEQRHAEEHCAAMATSFGLSLRSQIRPPLSPHRLGGISTLDRPRSADVALEALLVGCPARGEIARNLPTTARRLLMEEAPKGGRSEHDLAMAMSLVNAGFSFDDFCRLALSNKWPGSTKAKERSASSRYKYLKSVWLHAAEVVGKSPAPSQSDVPRLLDQLEMMSQQYRFNNRTGATDRTVLGALILRARKHKSLYIAAPCRDIADECCLNKNTVLMSLKRLQRSGWITPAGGFKKASNVASFKLEMPKFDPGESIGRTVLPGLLQAHPAFKRGALGGSCSLVWEALSDEPQAEHEITEATGLSLRTVRKHLKNMRRYGLVERSEVGYVRSVGADLDAVAAAFGTDEQMTRQLKLHDRERDLNRAYQLQRLLSRTGLVIIEDKLIDPRNGEIVDFSELRRIHSTAA